MPESFHEEYQIGLLKSSIICYTEAGKPSSNFLLYILPIVAINLSIFLSNEIPKFAKVPADQEVTLLTICKVGVLQARHRADFPAKAL